MKKYLPLILLLLLCGVKANATTYFLATAAGGGSDANSGLDSGHPWLSPAHATNCGDDITAAPSTSYSAANFAAGKWGTVTCSGGNNVTALQCAQFDACKITTSGGALNGMTVSANYWGVFGWEVTVSSGNTGCIAVAPPGGSTIHHIVIANNVANGCFASGISSFNVGSVSVDYLAIVGNAIYNGAQGTNLCFSGISVYQPLAADSAPDTHIYIGGNFSWNNVDANPCNGGTPSDGEGIILDSINDGQGGLTPVYNQRIVVDNNILSFNGNSGLAVAGSGNALAHVYLRHNTEYGNNTQQVVPTWCSDTYIDLSSLVEDFLNIIRTTSATSCNSGTSPLYGVTVNRSDATVHIYKDYIYSAAGNNTNINSSSGFATFGPNNITGTDPSFANPVNPGAPSCVGTSSVTNCMVTMIANFTPTVAAAKTYGYQVPNTTSVYDPLFPQWLCTVTGLPPGLVTMGCLPAAGISGVTINGAVIH